MKNLEALTFRIPRGLLRHVAGKTLVYLLYSAKIYYETTWLNKVKVDV
jgi:hypothetical protein